MSGQRKTLSSPPHVPRLPIQPYRSGHRRVLPLVGVNGRRRSIFRINGAEADHHPPAVVAEGQINDFLTGKNDATPRLCAGQNYLPGQQLYAAVDLGM